MDGVAVTARRVWISHDQQCREAVSARVGWAVHACLRLCQKGGMSALGSRRVGWDGEAT